MARPTLLSGWKRIFTPRVRQPARDDFQTIARIRDTATPLRHVSSRRLKEVYAALRERAEVDGLLHPEVFLLGMTAAYEAARRVLGIEFYDVQLLAGLALSRGLIAEMQTGEGKTFSAGLPTVLHALTGPVHVMTVNAYLAERDFELMQNFYEALGLSAGCLRADADPEQKKAAYQCDITYGPGYEFGFDYLRDQLAAFSTTRSRLGDAFRRTMRGLPEATPDTIQPVRNFAVIDEADSVLIDEAGTPLLLSGAGGNPAPNAAVYQFALGVAASLEEDEDFLLDRSNGRIQLTSDGARRIEKAGTEAAQHGLHRPWIDYVQQALHAAHFLQQDVDYVVRDGEVQLVDQDTGRIFADRSWRNGLHQAVQAKEGVTVTEESQPLARISRQRYFHLYNGACGMTGTAAGSEDELWNVYGLGVASIPTHRTSRRKMLPPRFFGTEEAKWQAIAAEAARIHQTRQPLLIGARTIEISQQIAALLTEAGTPHTLLNGSQDEVEADIVAGAGQQGAVTVSTNMAGRGTDVKLGPGVEELGGLYVIAVEPHESPRVDRQLTGRCARQGDPGVAALFVSADDAVLQKYAPKAAAMMKGQGVAELTGDFSRHVIAAQNAAARDGRERRQQMSAHNDWLEDVLEQIVSEN